MIRRVNFEDIDSIKTITNEIDLIKFIQSSDPFNKIYVFCLNNKIVGFISYSIIYERIELNYIIVDTNYRRQGIAAKLIEYMIEEGIVNGCTNTTLEVRDNNDAAINLYKKFGFTVTAKRPKYYGNNDGILMERVLIKR